MNLKAINQTIKLTIWCKWQIEANLREYKLKINSSKTYLVDSDPTKVVESFLDTLPEKNQPWIQTTKKNGREVTTYHGVCPCCNNPTLLVGYETRNSNSPQPYMKHYNKSIPNLAQYNESSYKECILASGNYSSFGNISKTRKNTDPLSLTILDTVKNQLDRIFYILEQDTGISFSTTQKIEMFKEYLRSSGYNYSSSYLNNLPWTFANILKSHSIYKQFVIDDNYHPVAKALAQCKNIKLESTNAKNKKQISSATNSFLEIFIEFRNLKIEKSTGDQSIDFRIFLKDSHLNEIKELYKQTIQINLTRFTNLINSKRSDYRQEKWEEMKVKIDEIQ